ncbi:NBR1-Ig-like domain-containing protein [Amycolatopsis kentuckyensis]|uniref:NBR1-Ig-like domain-containing protein n=1 Tax=Amycolatopsis kentuckyensis TaxID=218823 RepID=UPI003564C373
MDVERTPGRRGRVALGPAEESGPVAGFARRLWELKRAAGDPSYDRMRDELGALASKSALSAAARGRQLPSWETTWEFVRVLAVGVLGQDEPAVLLQWRGWWEQAREPEAEPAGAEQRALAPESEPAGLGQGAFAPESEPAGLGQGAFAPESEPPGTGRQALVPEPARRFLARESSPGREPDPAVRRRRGGSFARAASPGREPGFPARRRWAAYGLAAAVVAGLVVALFLVFGPTSAQEPAAGDVSEFVADVTVPDGTAVPAGSRFTKTWELRNAGSVGWIGRYLVRSGSFGSPDQCRTPDRVPVPYTAPGEHVRISVDVQAPPAAGHCQVYWKMADSEGHLLLPEARAVFFSVRITA